MKFLHLGDLHIGKRLLEHSLMADQAYITDQIVQLAVQHQVDGVLICGDIYDKGIPSEEAVGLFDAFLTKLVKSKIKVFVISGNHDSAERLAFGGKIMRDSGVYLCTEYDGDVPHVTCQDEFGPVHIYMLPFIKPASVNKYFDSRAETYHQAVQWVLEKLHVDKTQRNIILSHQFVTAAGKPPVQSDSEQLSVGGLDNVDIALYHDFDYVALGHIHGPQKVGRDTARYSGSPVKYSFSEQFHKKSVPLITMGDKGDVQISLLPLAALRDMATLTGTLEQITQNAQEFDDRLLEILLTDTQPLYDAIGAIKRIYPNVLSLKFVSWQSPQANQTAAQDVAGKSPLKLFDELFFMQHGTQLDQEQQAVLSNVLKEVQSETD